MKPVDCECKAFQQAIGLLGRPWTALILSVLQRKPLRFCELAEETDGPTDKVLSTRLKDLEAKGLISRTVEPGPPVRVTYALTSKGEAFEGVSRAIEQWGQKLVTR
jgi:DNA-binding HxlR family transcriptional regulator